MHCSTGFRVEFDSVETSTSPPELSELRVQKDDPAGYVGDETIIDVSNWTDMFTSSLFWSGLGLLALGLGVGLVLAFPGTPAAAEARRVLEANGWDVSMNSLDTLQGRIDE